MSEQIGSASNGVMAGTPRDVVAYGSAEGFTQKIVIGPHRLVADEPADVGGADEGPTPYDLLLAALGACTSMTVTLYARRKIWPLQGVTARLRHSRIHAVDCTECETKEGRIDRIELNVEFAGQFSKGQQLKLLEIAKKCPVHRTLTSEVDIRTRAEWKMQVDSA